MKDQTRPLTQAFALSLGFTLGLALALPSTSFAQAPAPALPAKASPAKAVPANTPKPAKKSANKKSAAKAKKDQPEDSRIPTTLPSFKGTKRIVINFDGTADSQQPTVVVRTELPLEKSLSDKARAEREMKAGTQVTEVKATDIPAIGSGTVIEVSEGGGENPSAPMTAPAEGADPQRPDATKITTTVSDAPPASTTNVRVSIGEPVLTDEEFSALRTQPKPKPKPIEPIPVAQESLPAEKLETPVQETLVAPPPRARTALDLPAYRLHFRTAYLDARYSRLEDRLQNGASALGIGMSQDLGVLETRIAFDMIHGLDQSVSAQNIRMTMARAEVARILSHGTVRPFFSGGLGLADYNVRSYRSTSGSLITIKEHAKGMALALIPGAGVKGYLDNNITLDFQIEYIALVGSSAPSVGGLGATASIGVGF